MSLMRAASMFGLRAAFQAGSGAAGRALIRNLRSRDENVRTLAGMFLVQAGRRSIPLLREALARGEDVPTILTMLADIGDPSTEPEIRARLNDPDPEIARAASDALQVLELQRSQ
ncbi:MAG TPA: HEAT repeat domain-containing protein [Thermoanaerobaculia bacterium]|nr:HEAT repeat domain-containing protein [Thermoanaerobaculia bacterium]